MHNAGIIYGYARVSTDSQDLTSQLAQLKAAGCGKVFREKITDTTADRPQLRKLMAVLTHGNVVIIPAVNRLSRPVAPAPMPRHHRGEGGDAALALDRRPIRAHPPLLGFLQMMVTALGTLLIGRLPNDSALSMVAVVASLALALVFGLLALRRPRGAPCPARSARLSPEAAKRS